MFDKIKLWYVDNYNEITWFLIGLLFATGVERFSTGNYSWALFYWAVAYLNYVFAKR
jgi:hypothetical protein